MHAKKQSLICLSLMVWILLKVNVAFAAPKTIDEKLYNTNILAIDDPFGVSLVLPADTLFTHPSGHVIDPEFYSTLDMVLAVLQDYPTVKISVSGHTDKALSQPHQYQRSALWAREVASYLTQRGLDPNRIAVIRGSGADRPIDDPNQFWGRAQNRRVEVTLHAVIP